MYCPKCKSRLFPGDQESISLVGVCSYCTTWDKRFREALQAKKEELAKTKKKRRN